MTTRAIASAKVYLLNRPHLRRLLNPIVKLTKSLRPSNRERLADSYEYLFENIVGGSVQVRVPDLGIFEMGCRSHILARILLDREYEPGLVGAIRKHIDPNKDALDIGANVGLFTTMLTSLLSENRRVLAVEPTPGALGYLKKNIEAHGCSERVILFEGVAEERRGEFTLKAFAGMEEYSTLVNVAVPAIKGYEYREIRVLGETIDHLVEQHELIPGLIKIDTEGAELHVLRGARQTILTHRPIIFCEVFSDEMISEAGERPGAANQFLRECGYIISNCEAYEILAIPKELLT
jgi:FkbM family methyltransferase